MSKYIELTRGYRTIVDDFDALWLADYQWVARDNNGAIYAYTTIEGHRFAMHWMLMMAPRGMHIDHANHDGLDNRRANLRVCTPAENQRNRRKLASASSRYKGVCWHRGAQKWTASICLAPQRSVYLGGYVDEVDAARAYDAAALEHFGVHAATNTSLGLLV